jgi:deoxyribodipyrimidine photo-lyase
VALFWHRRDLRPTDNRGLAAAGAESPAVPVFVFDEDVLEHASPNRVAFLRDSVEALRAAYRSRGGDLIVRRGQPATVLSDLAAELDVSTVHWNQNYSGLAQARDEAVAAALESAGRTVERHRDLLLEPPGSVLTNAGTPYQVFTPFYRTWSDQSHPEPALEPEHLAGTDDAAIPSLDALGFGAPTADIQPGGHDAARDRLEQFCEGPIYEYEAARDRPAADGTSRLSADLRFGTIGIRTVWQATQDAMDRAPDEESGDSVEAFQRQLAWREFYTDKLAHEPAMVAANHRDFDRPIEWRNDREEIEAWRAGETGYPFVDAGMRQLRAEGWLHNRLRMVVAAFLTKDLLADWRIGYRWFRRHLVDHDPGNDAGGWQWAASTGWDAQPYFRVFNPTTQGERFDPEAEYIQRYVPELRGVEPDAIHAWPTLERDRREELAPDYPGPIVDHAARREAAIDAFERARGN